jgi:sugar/nucleoside kinase (ribokinase family)
MNRPVNVSNPRFLFAGRLTRDFIVLPDGQVYLDLPGGNVIYSAVGLAVWETSPAPRIIARIGEDYPQEWLEAFIRRGIDTSGVRILPHTIDVRDFFAYSSLSSRDDDDPMSHFARHGLPFPKVLLGYTSKNSQADSRSRLAPISLRQGDISLDHMDATAAHICPIDYLTHSLLPSVLRQAGFTIVTMDPSAGYMNSSFWEELPALITGITAFLPAEEEVRALFQGRSADLWEMAEAISQYGCEMVVIKRGVRGQLLYDAAGKKRWEVPSYPVEIRDPTGAGDAFCGGFLFGYRDTYDPILAVLHGNISASFTLEGTGPFYALDALPGLAKARLEALRQSIRKV